MSATVLQFRRHKNQEAIKALEVLLNLAKSNRLTGMVLLAETDGHSGLYLTGRYSDNNQAATVALWRAHNIVLARDLRRVRRPEQ